MELKSLKTETKELITNSLDIYNALQRQNKLYRHDAMASISLYAGALRLGKTISVKSVELVRTSPKAGYPCPNDTRPSARSITEYQQETYNYENVVCQILNEYGVTIEQVITMLNLDKKLGIPISSSKLEKIERQYNNVYKALLQTIRNYYIASVKSTRRENCKPLIEMDIPTIISAIHYPNIDPSNSIACLYAKLKTSENPSTYMPDYLKAIESHVTYEEELGKVNASGQLELYRVRSPLQMNKNIGNII